MHGKKKYIEIHVLSLYLFWSVAEFSVQVPVHPVVTKH